MHGRRVITQLLLLFALLAGQHLALVHAVSHLPTGEVAGGKESGVPHGKLCAQCVLAAHLSHGLPSIAPLPTSTAEVPLEAPPLRGFQQAALILGFHSRAPPAPL